jgi:microcystin-dependent protein
MANPFLGEIRIFPFNFAPIGWAFCSGQLLPISQNTALFSLIGTYYGGNGTSTFALPDLQGRLPVGQGNGAGLSPYVLGQSGGVENVTLTTGQLASHSHAVNANASEFTSDVPAGHVLAQGGMYAAAPDGSTTLGAGTIGAAGSGQPHPNLQPYLAVNFCIALQGIYPSRN